MKIYFIRINMILKIVKLNFIQLFRIMKHVRTQLLNFCLRKTFEVETLKRVWTPFLNDSVKDKYCGFPIIKNMLEMMPNDKGGRRIKF